MTERARWRFREEEYRLKWFPATKCTRYYLERLEPCGEYMDSIYEQGVYNSLEKMYAYIHMVEATERDLALKKRNLDASWRYV